MDFEKLIKSLFFYLLAGECFFCNAEEVGVSSSSQPAKTSQHRVNTARKRATEILWMAAVNNDPTAVRDAVDGLADLKWRNTTGYTALHQAAELGHVSALTALLKAGAGVEAATDVSDRPIHLSASSGYVGGVALLAVAGAGLRARGQQGMTPLIQAIHNGMESAAALLRSLQCSRKPNETAPVQIATDILWTAVEKNDHMLTRDAIGNGADIEKKNGTGFTALHVAAALGHVEAMSVLLKAGANLEADTDSGDRPLHLAAASGNEDAAGLLLVAGADPKARDHGGMTPLLQADYYEKTLVAELLRSVLFCHDQEDNIEAQKANEILWSAVKRNNHLETLDAVRYGANIERQSDSGLTALHMAASYDHVETMSVLLKAGANKEANTNSGDRPLHIAAASGNDDAVALLAASGADLQAKGNGRMTPLAKATDSGWNSTAALLRALSLPYAQRNHTVNENATESLWTALRGNDPVAVGDAIMRGADIEKTDANGWTPLILAAAKDRVRVMSVLLRAGADKEAVTATYGNRALHTAAFNGNDEAVGMLVAAGADVRAGGAAGWTALMQATGRNRQSTASLLRSLGGWQCVSASNGGGHD